jgi:CRP/FNR family transcriptional regulator, cyclic AMP receptor protein
MADPRNMALLLAANPFFGGLGQEAIDAIAVLCVPRHLEREEVLFLKGDAGDALYAVRRGQIRIATGNASGRRLTLTLLGSGDVFGEVALLDGQPRTADAVAVEPTDLYMIHRRDFIELLAKQPKVAVRIIEFLCERIRWMSAQMEERTLMPLQTRLAHRLVALSEDYGAEIHVSQEELAVFVGATRESVNRQLQTWRREGVIELSRNRIRLIQPAGLGISVNGDPDGDAV